MQANIHPSLASLAFLEQYQTQRPLDKIITVPLEWEHLPADILIKEFTQLNNPHPYRIHYLGARPHDALAFHKRHGQQQDEALSPRVGVYPSTELQLYRLSLQKIVNCSFAGLHDNHPGGMLFYRAFEGMNPFLEQEQEFIFNGAFESGNLDCVIKVLPSEFDLFLRIDSNTRGHTGWYFFSIKNGNRKGKVTLNICNLRKPSPLYNQGMKPYIFSRNHFNSQEKDWEQGGDNCRFEEAQLRYTIIHQKLGSQHFYRLSFEYEFTSFNDEVFFAYCIPYTYSQLQQDVRSYCLSPFIRELSLGRSLSGLDLPLLHVSNHQEGSSVVNKKAIVITSRVHPGESNSSYLLKGIMGFLLGNSKQAEELRNQTNIFIVPMLNPDGVVLGNTRTSAAGKDLNRQFIDPQIKLYPEIHQLKRFVTQLQKKNEVMLYLDLHGHSRRKNTFLYGPNYLLQHSNYYQSRFLPKFIQKTNQSFRYYSCNFNISTQKRTTARAVMLSQMKVLFVYTVESSIGFYYSQAKMKILPFTAQLWEQMGDSISRGICIFTTILSDSELMTKERKVHRDRLKERAATSGGSRSIKTHQISEEDVNLSCSTKKGLSSLYLEFVKEIKASSNGNGKNMEEEELDSDDYDSEEDLPSSKLKEFKLHMARPQSPQKHNIRKGIAELQQLDIQFTVPVPHTHTQEAELEGKPGITIKRSPSKGIKSFKQKPSMRETKASQISQIESRTKLSTAGFTRSRKPTQQTGHTCDSSSRFPIKSLTVCKERYSIATKTMFPAEDMNEVLGIPKNLQIMRKEMKKGRMLIHSLEESRNKFIKREQPEVRRERRGPFVPVGLSKMRAGVRSSLSNFDYPLMSGISQQMESGPSQFNLGELRALGGVEGLQMDNMAMTITAFRRF